MTRAVNDLELMRLLRGEKTTKIPFWEVWFGMTDFAKRRYDSDMIKAGHDLGWQAQSIGTGGGYGEWGVDTNVHFMHTSDASDGTNHYDGGLLSTVEQMAERPVPDWAPMVPEMIRKKKRHEEEGFATWMVLPWCFHAIASSMGLENLALRCYDDIDFVHKAFEWVEERNRIAIDVIIREVRPDFVLIDGDCCFKSGLMINPKMFRELVFDRTKETLSKLRELDIPYTLHSDGKLDGLISMLVELGFSAVHGCEKASNNLKHLVDEFGDAICLVGNMDIVFLSKASVKEVRRETEAMLKIGGSKGRFVAACNTSPLDYIPDENYLAMADVIRNF